MKRETVREWDSTSTIDGIYLVEKKSVPFLNMEQGSSMDLANFRLMGHNQNKKEQLGWERKIKQGEV